MVLRSMTLGHYLYLAENVVSVFLMSLIKWLIIDERFTSSADTGHSPNAFSMLGQSRRKWPNIETALGEYPV